MWPLPTVLPGLVLALAAALVAGAAADSAGATRRKTPSANEAQTAALQEAHSLPTEHDGDVRAPQLSPDGSRIAYQVNHPRDNRTETWVVPLDGQSAVAGPPERLRPHSMVTDLLLRPDGAMVRTFDWAAATAPHRFAYTVDDATGHPAIYIDQWSGLLSEGANHSPRWSPDDSRFVFSSDRTGNGDIYQWDGGAETRLTFDDTRAELHPSWSPTGDRIAFTAIGKAESQVMLLDTGSLSLVHLVGLPNRDCTRPSFSPDGQSVAFLVNNHGDFSSGFSLWVVGARPGSTPRELGPRVRVPSQGTLSWTPDGSGVVAVLDAPERGDPIMLFRVDGGPPSIIASGTVANQDPQLREVNGHWWLVFVGRSATQTLESAHDLWILDMKK